MISSCSSSYVSMESFAHVMNLGQGGFGIVTLVQKKGGMDDGSFYAMKKIKKAYIMRSERHLRGLENEVEAMKEIDGRHSVRLYYTFQTQAHLHFIMDHVAGSDLKQYLRKCGRFTLKLTKFFVGQIMLALNFMHEQQIVCRDLKPANIMLGTNGYLKLIDFGHAKRDVKHWDTKMYTLVGTPLYLAPEAIRPVDGYTRMVDWWALGVMTYEMFFGERPFTGKTTKELHLQILEKKPHYPLRMRKDLKCFIQILLRKDPHQRAGSTGASELLHYELMQKMDMKALEEQRLPAPLPKRVLSDNDEEVRIKEWEVDETKYPYFFGFDYTAPEFRHRKRPALDEGEDGEKRPRTS